MITTPLSGVRCVIVGYNYIYFIRTLLFFRGISFLYFPAPPLRVKWAMVLTGSAHTRICSMLGNPRITLEYGGHIQLYNYSLL